VASAFRAVYTAPTEDAASKLLFLALRTVARKWQPIQDWREMLNHLTLLWGERIEEAQVRGRGANRVPARCLPLNGRTRRDFPALILCSFRLTIQACAISGSESACDGGLGRCCSGVHLDLKEESSSRWPGVKGWESTSSI
jgi:hypothetical protein